MSDSVRMTTASESPEVKRGREGKDSQKAKMKQIPFDLGVNEKLVSVSW